MASSMSSSSSTKPPLSRAMAMMFGLLIMLQLWTIYMNSTCRCESSGTTTSLKDELHTLQGLEEWRAQQPTLTKEEQDLIAKALGKKRHNRNNNNADPMTAALHQRRSSPYAGIKIPQLKTKQQQQQRTDMTKEELELARLVDRATTAPTQNEPYPRDSTVAVLGNKMDCIYILCYWKCQDVNWIPSSWNNWKVVDGHVFDSNRKVNNTWGSWKAHNQAVTVMHRAVVAHAKRENAQYAMILEEDVQPSPRDTPKTQEWGDQVLADQNWDILRLSHYWYTDYIRRFLKEEEETHALAQKQALEPIEKRLLALAGKGLFERHQWDTCPTDCLCTTSADENVCTLTPNQDSIQTMLREKDWYWKSFILGTSGMCDLRSSSAYIVPSRSFDFLISNHKNQDWASIIDLVRINALPNQKIIHPMPTVQKKNYGYETATGFESMCLVEATSKKKKTTRQLDDDTRPEGDLLS